MDNDGLEESKDSGLMSLINTFSNLQRIGPDNEIYSNIRNPPGWDKYFIAPMQGASAGLVEGVVGSVVLPTSIRIMSEEVSREYFYPNEEDSVSVRIYDRLYNDLRFASRGIVSTCVAAAIACDPKEYLVFAVGAGASLLYEGFRLLRNYLRDEEAEAAFED